jgi:glycosyltransferase involved in cell wall biosynthesis
MGGAPLSLLSLIQQLDRRRFEPEVLLLGRNEALESLFRREGIAVHRKIGIVTYPHAQGARLSLRSLRPWELITRVLLIPGSVRRMTAFLRSRHFDIVHLNSALLLPAGIGARRSGARVVWHVRETLHPGLLGVRRGFVRRVIGRSADRIVAISHVSAMPWSASGKVEVIYNPVDAAFDRRRDPTAFRAALGLPMDRPIVAMLGGAVPSKGADILVEAAARVLGHASRPLFVVAGYPPEAVPSPSPLKRGLRRALESCGLIPSVPRRILRSMAAHGLQDDVLFVGLRADVPDLLAASALLVWPAVEGHFSRPVIEAGAMGLPVVASDFAETREIVIDGQTGWLVPPRDPRALAAAIIRLLDDREAARRMGEEGSRLARERYDSRVAATRVERIYDDLLAGRAGGA